MLTRDTTVLLLSDPYRHPVPVSLVETQDGRSDEAGEILIQHSRSRFDMAATLRASVGWRLRIEDHQSANIGEGMDSLHYFHMAL